MKYTLTYKGPWQVHYYDFNPVTDETWVQYRLKGERTASLPMKAKHVAWNPRLIAYFRIVSAPKWSNHK